LEAKLFILGTTLGAIEDIPTRTLDVVRSCDLLVVEEDRPARQVLKAAGIHREYIKWNEHQSKSVMDDVRSALNAGKTVAYLSDQGMPNVADPGRHLLQLAYELGAKVKLQVVAGPSSVTAAIAMSPFDCSRFYFAGFLPKSKEDREAELSKLLKMQTSVVILETPYRRQSLLESLKLMFPAQRKCMIAIDISGANERYVLSKCGNMFEQLKELPETLNFVLVIDKP
jgi:16S rRNA (cytidine1402-2'-O)-methyltransferase